MGIVDWAAVAGRISFVPAEFSRPSVNRQTAREMLRCTDNDLIALVDAGLPTDAADDRQLFDPNDLYNLGMYSATGRTQPELAFTMLFRFTKNDLDQLRATRRWHFTLRLECVDCQGPGEWTVREPAGEVFGGGKCDVVRPARSSRTATYSAVVTTSGTDTPLLSSELRKVVLDYRAENLRWQMLPHALQRDPSAVHALGATDCIAASLYLAERFRAEGYTAHARRGWFCGVLGGIVDLPHAWVEVVDDDGHPKAVDVTTAQLAAQLSPETKAFQELCVGSAFNRVVLSEGLAADPFATHACRGEQSQVLVHSDIRAVRDVARDDTPR